VNRREKNLLGKLEWISKLSAKNHPGGMPKDEAEWKALVNRMVLEVRGVLSDKSDSSDQSDQSDERPLLDPYTIEKSSAETAANTILCLTHQATYLLKRQLENLEQSFLEKGGFTERLYKARTDYRRKR
jgi:four helix bundle suffix protein|tara:strand:+ start:10741 stop:11127 length:387 start_codon:yes stop_codon:yes gene_type:complete